MDNSRILASWTSSKGLQEIRVENTLHGWTDGKSGHSVRKIDDGYALIRSDQRGDSARAQFERVADADSLLLVLLGALNKDIRRRVKEWDKDAPVEKIAGGHRVTLMDRRALFSSVADARSFAAYVELRNEAGFPDDRLLTSLHLPKELKYGVPKGWSLADLDTLFASVPIDATVEPVDKYNTAMSLLGIPHRRGRDVDVEIAMWLLARGADVNFTNSAGKTPLYVHAGNPDLVKLFLSHGAIPEPTDPRTDTHSMRQRRSTPPNRCGCC